MDASFLAELRDWSEHARVAFEFRAETAWLSQDDEAGEVAALAARTFADLRTLCGRQIGAEEARLVAAVEEEQDGPGEVAARRALANFDAVTKGDE